MLGKKLKHKVVKSRCVYKTEINSGTYASSSALKTLFGQRKIPFKEAMAKLERMLAPYPSDSAVNLRVTTFKEGYDISLEGVTASWALRPLTEKGATQPTYAEVEGIVDKYTHLTHVHRDSYRKMLLGTLASFGIKVS